VPSGTKDFETAQLGVFAAPGLPIVTFNCGIREESYAVSRETINYAFIFQIIMIRK
jgi:hypothetical protein